MNNNTQLQIPADFKGVVSGMIDSTQDKINGAKIIDKMLLDVIVKPGSEWAKNPLFLLALAKYMDGSANMKTGLLFELFVSSKSIKPLPVSNETGNEIIEEKSVIDVDLSQIPVEEREALRNTDT